MAILDCTYTPSGKNIVVVLCFNCKRGPDNLSEVLNDIKSAVEPLSGKSLPRPEGTLSGHAAGLPFERSVHALLKGKFGERCEQHFESLNVVLCKNQSVLTYEARAKLFGPLALRQLILRGKTAMQAWSPENLFEEKQDDTAESIIFPSSDIDFYGEPIVLLDVKTTNASKKAQPPNIISAEKLANSLLLGLQGGRINFDIVYVAVSWSPSSTQLVCGSVRPISMFKISKPLYINWAAAQQVQFHPLTVDQDFKGNREEWALNFLENFCRSLEGRISKEVEKLERFKKALR